MPAPQWAHYSANSVRRSLARARGRGCQTGIDLNLRSGRLHRPAVYARPGPARRVRRRHQRCPLGTPIGAAVHGCGVDACHVKDVLEQPRQTIEFLERQSSPEPGVREATADVLQIGRRRRGQTSPAFWRSWLKDVQERRREVSPLAQRLSLLSLRQEVRALDRNGDHTAKRVERARF